MPCTSSGALSPPAAEPARAIAERQVRHLARLVDDLLDVSRIDAGKIELRPALVALHEVVGRAVDSARPLVESRGHNLTVSLPAEPIRLMADPARLEQVLANLLNNASKYTDPGGDVYLDAAHAAGEATIRVRDTGIGIAPELLPRVFDLFTQAERSLDRSQGGLGIGLTLVRRLVELHGGVVSASSEGIGRGSEFTIRLPTDPVPPPDGAPPTAGVPPPPARCSRGRRGECSSSRTTPMGPSSSPGSSGASATMRRWSTTASRHSKRLGTRPPNWSCWISGCPGWTATRWHVASASARVRSALI